MKITNWLAASRVIIHALYPILFPKVPIHASCNTSFSAIRVAGCDEVTTLRFCSGADRRLPRRVRMKAFMRSRFQTGGYRSLATARIYFTLSHSLCGLDTGSGFATLIARRLQQIGKPHNLTHLRHTGKFSSCCPPHPSAMENATTSAGSVLHDLKDSKEPIIACDLGW